MVGSSPTSKETNFGQIGAGFALILHLKTLQQELNTMGINKNAFLWETTVDTLNSINNYRKEGEMLRTHKKI